MTKDERRRFERRIRNQKKPQYQVISTPKRDSPNYIVKGPGRENVMSISPAAFDRSGSSLTYRGPEYNPDAVRAVEQATGQTARTGVVSAQAAPVSRSSIYGPRPTPEPDTPPYTLLPGMAKARVYRPTLLRGGKNMTTMIRRAARR